MRMLILESWMPGAPICCVRGVCAQSRDRPRRKVPDSAGWRKLICSCLAGQEPAKWDLICRAEPKPILSSFNRALSRSPVQVTRLPSLKYEPSHCNCSPSMSAKTDSTQTKKKSAQKSASLAAFERPAASVIYFHPISCLARRASRISATFYGPEEPRLRPLFP